MASWRALLRSLIALMWAPAILGAQGLRGTVVDSLGRALRDAEVIVVEPDVRTRTDEFGGFQIAGMSPGQHIVRVRLVGYRPFESSVTVSPTAWTDLRVVLQRMPPLLAEVRVTDTRRCVPNTLVGFECRRASGRGLFRDAGELRSLKPSAWADMLDGMPMLRRRSVMTPHGIDWWPAVPTGRCLVQIFNGEDPRYDGHVRRVPMLELVPQDVVAIEFYPAYADVPEAFKRYAWPRGTPEACSLLVYWLRIAPAPKRGR